MFGDNRKVNIIMRCPKCGKVYPANETMCQRCWNQNLVSESEYKKRGGQPSLKSYQTKINSNNQSLPKCPICGSTDLKKLDVLDRGLSVFMWGLGSNKIGKTYECRKCKATF